MPTLIAKPTRITAAGNKPKLIDEYIGRVNSAESRLSVAHMRSPGGWVEPGQTPEFDEFTIVLRGTLRVAHKHGALDVNPGQAVVAHAGEWVQYSTPLPEGAEYIAVFRERLGLHPRSALDFFDALVALGFLERRHGKYFNRPETDYYLDRNKPSYAGGILEMCSVRLYSYWGSFTEALRTGLQQNESKNNGKDFFADLYKTPEKLEGFLKGMTGLSLSTAKAIAEKFPWADYKTFADVGAAQGAVPVELALAHPHLKGIGYDLPVVKPIFEKFTQSRGVADRVRFEAGDFFKEALPNAEVIIMGHILHDWNLEQKKTLIRKAYEALPKGGAFIVYEALIDDDRRESAMGLLMSLNMLIETPGGFDYTGADCQSWMRETGFRETRVEHLVGPDSMVIGIK